MLLRRLSNLVVIRARQTLYRNKVSYPYLTGDFFAKIADVALFDSQWNSRIDKNDAISKARVIFCPGDHYEKMVNEFSELISAKILILGNSDRDYDGPLENLPVSIKTVYRQNSTFFNEVYRFIPIGIENFRLGLNGLPKLFKPEKTMVMKSRKILIGPFSRTHSERDFFISLKEGQDTNWKLLDKRISPGKYGKIAKRFLYIACPRGNGLDTHRFWETLYRGSYPIVKKSKWALEVESLGIPVIVVNEWSESELEALCNKDNLGFEPLSVPALWANYWISKIRADS